MADTGNRKTLLGGSGREQRAGTAKQNALQLPLIELIEKIPA